MYVVWSRQHRAYFSNRKVFRSWDRLDHPEKTWTKDIQEVLPFTSISAAKQVLNGYMEQLGYKTRIKWSKANFHLVFEISTVKLELGEVV